MLEIFTAPFKLKLAEIKYKNSIYEKAQRLLEYEEVPDPFADLRQQYAGLQGKELGEFDLVALQAQMMKLYFRSPHIRGIIDTLRDFVIGKGVIIKSKDGEEFDEYWEAFETRMNDRCGALWQWELFIRTWRDGEVFLRFFGLGTLEPKFIFIDPNRIADPTGKHTHGIETDPQDVYQIINYYLVDEFGRHKETIPAEEIVHIKWGDSNTKRGRTKMEPVLTYIAKYYDWLETRTILNKLRSAVVMVRKIKGDTSDIDTLVQTNQSTKNTGITNKIKNIRPGTVISENEASDTKFISPNLDSKDANTDGRNILLCVAVGLTLPEYIVTGDASNSNYSSTMVSESPAVRSFESQQTFFGMQFTRIYQKITKAAVATNVLPEKVDKEIASFENGDKITTKVKEKVQCKCTATFPEIVMRNFLDKIKGLIMLLDRNIMSEDTVADKVDVDLDEEDQKSYARQIKRKDLFGSDFESQRKDALDKNDDNDVDDDVRGEE